MRTRYTAGMRTFMLLLAFGLCSVGVLAESTAGLRWTAPPGWKNEGPAPMRAATYLIPAAPGDQVGAECGVYFFGPGQGGSVDANLDRWNGQFTDPKGAPAAGKVARRTVHGLPITTLDVSGVYLGLGGPTASDTHAVAGYRLLGAIIDAPGGRVFIKLTGPGLTVAENLRKFEELLASFQPER
jgi:hypothetical protein